MAEGPAAHSGDGRRLVALIPSLLGWAVVFALWAPLAKASGGPHGEPVPWFVILVFGVFTAVCALIGGYLLSLLGFEVGRRPGRVIGALLGGAAGSLIGGVFFGLSYLAAST